MDKNFWNSVTTYGLYLALISIIYALLTPLVASTKIVVGILWVIKLCATIYVLHFAMKRFCLQGDDTDSPNTRKPFAPVFRFGFFTSLCSGIIYAAYTFVENNWIHPEAIEKTIEQYMSNAAAMGMDGQLDPHALASLANLIPLVLLVYYVILGLIFSAIIAKRLQPKELNDIM